MHNIHALEDKAYELEGQINVTQTANSHLQSMVDAHGLVIFPMSGNNSFKTPDFADLASLLKHGWCIALSHHVFRKTLLQNMKQVILCSLFKEFCLLQTFDWRKIKEQIVKRRNVLDI